MVREAIDRNNAYIGTVDEYLATRRYTIGATPTFAIFELGLNIPDEVMEHPVIDALCRYTTDMVILRNVS